MRSPCHFIVNVLMCIFILSTDRATLYSVSNQFIFQGLLDLNSFVVVTQTAFVLSILSYRFLHDSLDAFSCNFYVFCGSLVLFFLCDISRGCLSLSFFFLKFLMMSQIIWFHRIVQSSVNDLIKVFSCWDMIMSYIVIVCGCISELSLTEAICFQWYK